MHIIHQRIAAELNINIKQVDAAVALLDEGATVPFISRYRKEVTGALDDTQLRNLEERLRYLRELEERRATILKTIDEQGKLTPELANDIQQAETKNRLEDLYLPYKIKRRTKAQIAREAGLEPLADLLFNDPTRAPEQEALAFINTTAEEKDKLVPDVKAALEGAKQILMERFSEDADLLANLRQYLLDNAKLSSRVATGKETEAAKFQDYFEHNEPLAKTPSHRALAMFRGRNESLLSLSLTLGDGSDAIHPCEILIAEKFSIKDQGRPADSWLREVVKWAWRVKLYTHLETDLLGQLRERAEIEAIKVFATNLKDLLLAAPAGPRITIGLDPGLRTGVKVVVIDNTGKVLDHGVIYPHTGRVAEAAAAFIQLCKKHNPDLVAIGNGTGSRETEKFVADIIKLQPDLKITTVIVSEAGASVYSASEYAAREFPDLDVTIRGAISIARRLQDPLAELVKIDPKAIGVGQYQHDVSQTELARMLDAVVEDCVNAVGVDLNTASPALLTRVSGLNQTIASNIVAFRETHGMFKNRSELKKVPRLGDKTFEQAAGFLRVMNGDNPLDASGVHPEAYAVVETIAAKNGKSVKSLIGDSATLRNLKAAEFVDEKFGLPTVTDIIKELDKPGRDPRPEFKTATFAEGINEIRDLTLGMILEGTVTNVANFGAFVDIGVHQDGLVHISALSNTYIKDPREAVKTGDIVKVKVMEIDAPRKRISLSMRLSDEPGQAPVKTADRAPRAEHGKNDRSRNDRPAQPAKQAAPINNAFAAAFANAKQK